MPTSSQDVLEHIKMFDSVASTSLDEYHKKLWICIEEIGQEPTLQFVECVNNTNIPLKTKVARAERHLAFQFIPRAHQFRIHSGDEETIQHFARQLLSSMAVQHGFYPIGKSASMDAWKSVIKKLRNVDRPQPQHNKPNEAARRARQLERSSAGPLKGSNPAPAKHGQGNTKNARKRARAAR